VSSSDHLDKYPLLAKVANPPGYRTQVSIRWIRPPDARWLPADWESSVYPKGETGSNNGEALRQWCCYKIERYTRLAQLTRTCQSDPAHDEVIKAVGQRDRGAASLLPS